MLHLAFHLFGHALPLRLGAVELILSLEQTLLGFVPLFDDLVVIVASWFAFDLFSEFLTLYFLQLLLEAFVFACCVFKSIAHNFEHLFVSFHKLDFILHSPHLIIFLLIKPCQLLFKCIPPRYQYTLQSFMYEIQIGIKALLILVYLDNLILHKRYHLIDRRHVYSMLLAQLVCLTEARRCVLYILDKFLCTCNQSVLENFWDLALRTFLELDVERL